MKENFLWFCESRNCHTDSKNSALPRAIISAIDGMIDAEKARVISAIGGLVARKRWLTMGRRQETGTKSNLVNFTATFSFAPCAVWALTKRMLMMSKWMWLNYASLSGVH